MPRRGVSDSYSRSWSSPQELASLDNLRGRFFLFVDRSGECWPWLGPRHSSGAGKYLWRVEDGGNDRYILAHRLAYFMAVGERPKYLRNLCGTSLCCRASHWRAKPSEHLKPKPRKAIRGRVRQLSDQQIQQIRLLDSVGSNENEVGQHFGLTKRQVAEIAMGHLRPEAGGRIRTSRHLGIKHYHEEWVRELVSLSMQPDSPPIPQPPLSVISNSETRPFPHTSYGHPPRRRTR